MMSTRGLATFLFFIFGLVTSNKHDTLELEGVSEINKIYRGCGFIKQCVKICLQTSGNQNGCKTCIKNRNCPAMVTIQHHNGQFRSQMIIREVSDQSDYIAMGLSRDQKMLKSPYVACVHRSDTIDKYRLAVYSGYTSQDYTFVNYFDIENITAHIFFNKEAHVVNVPFQARQAMYCEFNWRPSFTVHALSPNSYYDLNLDTFYIIAATGYAGDPRVGDWALSAHSLSDNGRIFTEDKVSFIKVPILDPDYDQDYDCESSVCDSTQMLLISQTLFVFILHGILFMTFLSL